MLKKSMTLGKAWESTALFSFGVVASGRILHTAGITARNDDGSIFAPNDMRRQVEKVFEIIGEILQEAGTDWSNIIKYSIFATDVVAYNEDTRDIRARYFVGRPAATAIQVPRLVHPDMVVEIEAIASVPMPDDLVHSRVYRKSQ